MFKFDKRYLYIIIGIIIFWNVAQRLQNPSSLLSLVLTLPAVIIAMTFHEYAHAFAADKLGDDTPRSQGRLTLNPLRHIEPIGFFLLLFAGFGWGRPVEINTSRFNSKFNKSQGEAIVAFAGPFINIILAIISAFVLGLLIKFRILENLKMQYAEIIILFLMQLLYINLGLGIFNLIPLPPLDGEKIFKNVIPYRLKEWLDRYYYTLYVVFMILWFTGLLEIVVRPVINFFIFWLLKLVEQIYKLIALLILKIFG